MHETINANRRRLLNAAAMTIPDGHVTVAAAAQAQSASATTLGPLRQIDAGVLMMGWAELGRSDAAAVIMLLGCPYDIYSYVDVALFAASAD